MNRYLVFSFAAGRNHSLSKFYGIGERSKSLSILFHGKSSSRTKQSPSYVWRCLDIFRFECDRIDGDYSTVVGFATLGKHQAHSIIINNNNIYDEKQFDVQCEKKPKFKSSALSG